MRMIRARRIRTNRPKGSGRRFGRYDAAAHGTAERTRICGDIPAWNMRSLLVEGNLAPPKELAARLPFISLLRLMRYQEAADDRSRSWDPGS
jgi:hypothetical protein